MEWPVAFWSEILAEAIRCSPLPFASVPRVVYPRFTENLGGGHPHEDNANHSQRIRPANVIVLPVWHPVTTVSVRAKNQHCDCAAERCNQILFYG